MDSTLKELNDYPNINESKGKTELTSTEEPNNGSRKRNPELINKISFSNINDMYVNKSNRNSVKNVTNGTMLGKQFEANISINTSSRDHLATVDHRQRSDQGYSQPKDYLNLKEFKTSYSKNIINCPNSSQERIHRQYSRGNRPTQTYDNNRYQDVPYSLKHKYDDKFIHKTLQTNIRLQNILAKIIIECRRDKQINSWNNYIKQLKNKHGYYNNERTRNTQYISEEYFNDELAELHSDQVQNLLNDIYGHDIGIDTDNEFSYVSQREPERIYFKNNNVCYPTSSQALINMRRKKYNEKYYRGKSILVDSNFERPYKRYNLSNIISKQINNVKEMVVQTEINLENFNKQSVLAKDANTDNVAEKTFNIINTIENTSNIINNVKRKLSTENVDKNVKSFEEVQGKLDNLIESVNSVILAVKSLLKRKDNEEIIYTKDARPIPEVKSVTDIGVDISNIKVSEIKNNVREIYQTNNDFITMVLQNTNRQLKISEMSTSMSQFREFTMSNMDKVIEEEMEKSKRIKRDIQELLHTRCERQCSVQLASDIPTKESKVISCPDSDVYFDVADQPNSPKTKGDFSRKATIAVNTDPLSIPALLKVSTDALKGLLSYMPQLDYNTYVSMLPISRPSVPNYICYICGDTFSRMSQLTDHVQQHNLRKMRNCSACADVLGVENDQIGPFECKYCEQKFIRSYCCELHQQNCAKSLGKKHHDLSYLLYLK